VIITELLIFFSSGVKFISIFHFFSDNVELGGYTHSPQGYQQVGNPAPEGHDYSLQEQIIISFTSYAKIYFLEDLAT
jgi:hypothetical protein